MKASYIQNEHVKPPKFVKKQQWKGYRNLPWFKKDKKSTTILYNMMEKRKSFFLRAYFDRKGYLYKDLGDHIKEDVRWGKEWGNRMECNPMYFTSGSLIRNLMLIHNETKLTKAEIVDKYIFLGGGGQCGPCRYGMYPQEYMKVVNDAGFKNFRILIFSSEIIQDPQPKGSAFNFDILFKINFMISFILADFMHIAECALRPYAKDKKAALKTIKQCEKILYKTFKSKLYLLKLPFALRKVGKILADVPRNNIKLPLIFVTGEVFANLAHGEGNYNLRRFIMDEGCEVLPGFFTQRGLYESWRRIQEALRGIKYAQNKKELKKWQISLRKNKSASRIVKFSYELFRYLINPKQFGGHSKLMDLDMLAQLGYNHYHPEIFGGEGNLEVAEAIHFSNTVDGFISCKPFGCMPSSGVSDGVQAKIMSMHPNLNFLSIETSGDNEVSILSRVSMLLFKAKQKVAHEIHLHK